MPRNQQLASGSLYFETAGEHVLSWVPSATPESGVEEIRRSLIEDQYDSLTHVAILDGAKLAGVLTIENLFSAPKEAVAQEVMDPAPPVVAPGTDQEVAAWQAISGDGDTGPALDPHILHHRVMDRRMNIRNVRKGCFSRRRR
jgi:CBS domain-containing protein